MAMKISDFCNSAIDYIDAFSDGLVDTAITKVIDLASDPIGCCKDMVVGAVVVSGYLLKVVHEYLHQSILSYINPDASIHNYLNNVDYMTNLLEVAQVYYQNNSGPQIVQKSTELLTDVGLDFYLGGKVINALSNFCKVGVAQQGKIDSLFKRIFQQKARSLETAEGYRLLLSAEEASSILKNGRGCSKAALIVEQTSQTLVAQSTLVASPPMISAQSTQPKLLLPELQAPPQPPASTALTPVTLAPPVRVPVSAASHVAAPKAPNQTIISPVMIDYVQHFDAAILPNLVSTPCKSLSPIAHVYPPTGATINLFMDVRHIFLGEVCTIVHKGKVSEKLLGFHHDYMGQLRQSGRVSYVNVKPGIHGTYKAQNVIIDGKKYNDQKTFFPESMTHQEVIDNIWGALRNGQLVLQPNGRLRITDKGKSGIEIVCIVDSQGKIITAYPVV